uniref:Uncharacterized protein n=1 Tax=Chelonoidis abingdonii TaxID=106734 RepID=A0A8C0GH66_CHEAB
SSTTEVRMVWYGIAILTSTLLLIIGCQVRREPLDSTERYTRWINNLTPGQLLTQVFTSHGPTVIMPTWFCSREWFCHVGKFDEGGKGIPEDLLFFYEHIRKGGGVFRVDQCLLQYRYHPQAATHSVLEETIWNHRVRFLEDRALKHWTSFTIWNAGKQGRKLYRSLSPANQKKVAAFCDVDENKIAKGFYTYQESKAVIVIFLDLNLRFNLQLRSDRLPPGQELIGPDPPFLSLVSPTLPWGDLQITCFSASQEISVLFPQDN